MRFYTKQHQHYCGIDLHARTLLYEIHDIGRFESVSNGPSVRPLSP
ncbi:hypothetical protein ACFL3S_08620 [Gemmatimonadota bacterium]